MKTVTIDGREYRVGTARVEPDVATLSGHMVVMQLTSGMTANLQRFTHLSDALARAAELNNHVGLVGGFYWVTVLTTGDITIGHYDGSVWRIIGHEDTFDDHFIRVGKAVVRGN